MLLHNHIAIIEITIWFRNRNRNITYTKGWKNILILIFLILSCSILNN